ncbi:hypothetical protein RQP46_002199 [Phenoliferia psychrophenolica]
MWFELPFTIGSEVLDPRSQAPQVETPRSYSDRRSEFDFPPPTPPISDEAESPTPSDRTLFHPVLQHQISFEPLDTLDFRNGPVRALVVDDDLLTRRLMSRMVERLWCVVEVAENGAVALESILAVQEDATDLSTVPQRYDIILLDNQFIVGVTANAQLLDQEEFIREGATTVLTKPIKEGDLKKLLLLADRRKVTEEAEPGLHCNI